jgi:hypothetical protein
MNFPGVLTHRARQCALAVAAVAVLAVGLQQSGPASAASSGGIGTGTASGGQQSAADDRPSEPVGARYDRLWDRFSVVDKRWAHATSECESGGDPGAIGGGGLYRGAFQFMRSTWKASPRSPGGDPIAFSYRTQAVVAVLLKHRDGAGHWPVCG